MGGNTNDNLFTAISHKTRRMILLVLKENQRKNQEIIISQLAKQIRISSMQLLGKHLKILSKVNLIKKDKKKRSTVLSLTVSGSAIMPHLFAIDFLKKNKKYFQTHSLEYLPEEFIARIGELHNYKKITGVGSTIQKYAEIMQKSNEFLKMTTVQNISDTYKQGIQNTKQKNNTVWVIFGKNTLFPKGFKKLRRECNEDELIRTGRLKQRMVEHVDDVLIVTETEAGILFPKADGFLDATIMFYSKDPIFRKWCNDLFEYTWERTSVFSEDKIIEQDA